MGTFLELYPEPLELLTLISALVIAWYGCTRGQSLIGLLVGCAVGAVLLFIIALLRNAGSGQPLGASMLVVSAAGVTVPLTLASAARFIVRKRTRRVQLIMLITIGLLAAPLLSVAELVVACGVGLGCV